MESGPVLVFNLPVGSGGRWHDVSWEFIWTVLVCAVWLQIPAVVLCGFEPLPPGDMWERRGRVFPRIVQSSPECMEYYNYLPSVESINAAFLPCWGVVGDGKIMPLLLFVCTLISTWYQKRGQLWKQLLGYSPPPGLRALPLGRVNSQCNWIMLSGPDWLLRNNLNWGILDIWRIRNAKKSLCCDRELNLL